MKVHPPAPRMQLQRQSASPSDESLPACAADGSCIDKSGSPSDDSAPICNEEGGC